MWITLFDQGCIYSFEKVTFTFTLELVHLIKYWSNERIDW